MGCKFHYKVSTSKTNGLPGYISEEKSYFIIDTNTNLCLAIRNIDGHKGDAVQKECNKNEDDRIFVFKTIGNDIEISSAGNSPFKGMILRRHIDDITSRGPRDKNVWFERWEPVYESGSIEFYGQYGPFRWFLEDKGNNTFSIYYKSGVHSSEFKGVVNAKPEEGTTAFMNHESGTVWKVQEI